MDSFSDVIDLWPTVAAFAKDIGLEYPTAAAMKRRNSIDSRYWARVVASAKERGFDGVTPDRLMAIAAESQRGAA